MKDPMNQYLKMTAILHRLPINYTSHYSFLSLVDHMLGWSFLVMRGFLNPRNLGGGACQFIPSNFASVNEVVLFSFAIWFDLYESIII